MKKNLIYALAVLTIALTNCTEPLEEKLISSPGLGDFYKSEADAELAIAGVYTVFWGDGIYKDLASIQPNGWSADLMVNNGNPNDWNLFSWTPSEKRFEQRWQNCYLGINRANTLIDKLGESDVSQAIKDEYIGQAKFLRALFYFELVRHFGGVPIHLNATVDLSEVAKERSSESEVYAQIENDLMDAEQLLSPFDADNHAAGKATLGSVKGLLAKVYLQQRDWGNAGAKAKEVIDLGVYELYKDYKDIWDPAMKNGSEHVFSVQHNNGGNNTSDLGNHVSYDFVPGATKLPNGTNVRFAVEGSLDGWIDSAFYLATPETHRKLWTMRASMPYYWKQTSSGYVYEEGNVDLEHLTLIKYYHPDIATGNVQTGVNDVVIRYSDVLLIYAEALNESGGSETEKYWAINQVRQRARAVGTAFEQDASVYPDLSGLSQSDFRDAVLLERAREFIGEGERRNDLRRHDLFLQNARDRGINAPDGYDLFPLPGYHILQNPLLEQNDAYK